MPSDCLFFKLFLHDPSVIMPEFKCANVSDFFRDIMVNIHLETQFLSLLAEEHILTHLAASVVLPWHIKPRLRHPLEHFALDQHHASAN